MSNGMKVILVQDVARLGRRSEIKDVPRGHALNFLIPRGLAIVATSENLKRHKEIVSKLETRQMQDEEAFLKMLKELKDKTITYEASSNEKDNLFKGIGEDAIVAILKDEGYDVDTGVVKIKQPIKSLGVFDIPLERGKNKGICKIEIVKKK